MKTKILVLSIIQCLFIASCNLLYPDEKLSLPRTNYTGNEIRTDGYYYNIIENDRIVFRFFYKNGTVLSGGAFSFRTMDEAESKMIQEISKNKKRKWHWGVFVIEGDKIDYEQWEPSIYGNYLTTRRYYGHIENDTTIHFTESYTSENKKPFLFDFVYHFKQFANKPDSTNNFIK